MSYLAIFKRVVPFLLTFAAGLLIASIFIPISAPNFSRGDRGRMKWDKCNQHNVIEQLKQENERLQQENDQLRFEKQTSEFKNLKWTEHDNEQLILLPVPTAPSARVQNHTHDR